MRESEYRRLKQRIESDYRKKLDALELVWKMSGGSNGKPSAYASDTLEGKTKGQLVKAIRGFLHTASGEFTISDIQTALRRDHPTLGEVRRQSIATALRRHIRRHKDIDLSAEGKGRTEAKYRKV